MYVHAAVPQMDAAFALMDAVFVRMDAAAAHVPHMAPLVARA